jgi:hypothetical protein
MSRRGATVGARRRGRVRRGARRAMLCSCEGQPGRRGRGVLGRNEPSRGRHEAIDALEDQPVDAEALHRGGSWGFDVLDTGSSLDMATAPTSELA